MYHSRYVLSDYDKRKYSTTLANYCVEGDRTELLTQVRENKEFCRDQTAISYDYLIQSLASYSCVYIENESHKILGACAIGLRNYITVYAICVPDGVKGIGTLLLNNVKMLGNLIGAEGIGLSAGPSVYKFYERNGFTQDKPSDSDSEDEPVSDKIHMTYILKRTGGKYRTKKQKARKKMSRKNRRF